MSGIRRTIMKAIGEVSGRGAAPRAAANVVPFPKAKARPKKRTTKPKVLKQVFTDPDSGVVTDVNNTTYKKTTISGKQYLRREDGALFTLRKDGKWVLTSEPRARRKKGGSTFGKVLPYAAAGGVGAAGAYLMTRRDK